MLEELLEQYLKNLTNTFQRGDVREESYYTNLDELIKKMAAILKVKNIDVTILPKKTEAGNPDFRIWDENIIGTDTYFQKIKMNSNNDFSKNVHRNWGQASQLHKI